MSIAGIFDGGALASVGTAASVANTGANTVIITGSGTAVATTDFADHSPFAVRCSCTATNPSGASIRFNISGGTTTFRLAHEFEMDSIPTVTKQILSARNGTPAVMLNVSILNTGKMILQDTSGTTLATTTEVLQAGVLYRLELRITAPSTTTGTYSFDIYSVATGLKVNATTYSGSAANFLAAAVSTIDIGNISNATAAAWSMVAANFTVDPASATGTIGPIPYVWSYRGPRGNGALTTTASQTITPTVNFVGGAYLWHVTKVCLVRHESHPHVCYRHKGQYMGR